MNLLQETLEKLGEHGVTKDDVRWVGAKDWFTWEEYAKLADMEYDDGYGGQEICASLVVVGDDWWLERHEYDGSEWWEFKKLPIKPACHCAPLNLYGRSW